MPKILLVDDNPRCRELTGFALLREGYEVDVATTFDVTETAHLRTEDPDLVVIDAADALGFDLAAKLRRTYGPDVPIMLVSRERQHVALSARAMEAGVWACISKSDGIAALVARVKAALLPHRPSSSPTERPSVRGQSEIRRLGETSYVQLFARGTHQNDAPDGYVGRSFAWSDAASTDLNSCFTDSRHTLRPPGHREMNAIRANAKTLVTMINEMLNIVNGGATRYDDLGAALEEE